VTIDVLARVGLVLGEGPLWHAERGSVLWVDILAGHVWECALGGEPRIVVEHHEPVGCLALARTGELVGMTGSGLWRLDPEPALLVANPEASPDLRANDGKADPTGRFVGGTMGFPEPTPAGGTLWSFADGTARPLLRGLTISNGLAWWTDPTTAATTMYHVDTPTGEVRAYDYDLASGSLGGARTLAAVHPGDGLPDGVALDVDGGLWVALHGGGKLHRYDPDGALTAVVELPVAHVTCPAFVGPGLTQLVVTTATEAFQGDPGTAPPGAGDVYLVDPGVAGAATHEVDLAVVIGEGQALADPPR
jgi:sugar lactone lactonase YvrE